VSQNSKSRSRDPRMTSFDLTLHFLLVLSVIHLYSKFEVSTSTVPEILGGPKIPKNGSRDPHMTPFDLILQILDISSRFQCL